MSRNRCQVLFANIRLLKHRSGEVVWKLNICYPSDVHQRKIAPGEWNFRISWNGTV